MSYDLSRWTLKALNLEDYLAIIFLLTLSVQMFKWLYKKYIKKEKKGVSQYKHENINLVNNNNNNDNNIIVTSRLIVESITNINHVILKTQLIQI